MKKIAWLLLCGSLAACAGNGDRDVLSELSQGEHAAAADAETTLLRVRNADRVFTLLLTSGRAYRLECADYLGWRRLIESTGYDTAFLETLPIFGANDPMVPDYLSNPILDCRAAQDNRASLHAVSEPAGVRYYLSFRNTDGANKQILHNVGCQALIPALGFDVKNASVITPELKGMFFNAADDYDLNCYQGKAPGLGAPTLSASAVVQAVKRGDPIQPIAITATAEDGVTVSVEKTADTCGWLQFDGATLSGKVSTAPSPASCEARFVARRGNLAGLPALESAPLTIRFDVSDWMIRFAAVQNTLQHVTLGQSIVPIQLQAWLEGPDGQPLAYPIGFHLDNGGCGWLQLAGSSVIGTVPTQKRGLSLLCQAAVRASAPGKATSSPVVSLTIEVFPWSGSVFQKLSPLPGTAYQGFGQVVAQADSRVAVGAPYDDDRGAEAGAVYVYEQNAYGQWSVTDKLWASDPVPEAKFGAALAMHGNTLVVGTSRQGAYVFELRGGRFVQTARLLQFDLFIPPVQVIDVGVLRATKRAGAALRPGVGPVVGGVIGDVLKPAGQKNVDNYFGGVVAVSGNVIAVAGMTFSWDSTGSDEDRFVMLFERDSAGGWGRTSTLRHAKDEGFGSALALSGGSLAVGAAAAQDRGAIVGAVYLYRRSDQGVWSLGQTIPPSQRRPYKYFGSALGLTADTLAVGAPWNDDFRDRSGTVEVYRRDVAGQFAHEQSLTGVASPHFGSSVAVVGDTVAGTARYGNAVVLYQRGTIPDLLRKAGGSTGRPAVIWSERARIALPQPSWANDLALGATTLVVGASGTNDQGINTGVTYMY